MAILQAIFAFLSRSSGKLLNAIFGWAVTALFGKATPKEQTFLTIVVALAAVWPFLLVGLVAPRFAAVALAFVPVPESAPAWILRAAWAAIALLVPILVGFALSSKARPDGPIRDEGLVRRVLRGFPVTAALAIAFALMFVTVPFVRISTILRRWKETHVTLLSEGPVYHETAAILFRAFRDHGLDVDRVEPPGHMTAPTRVLLRLGGKVFRGFVPEKLHYMRSKTLRAALYPNDLLLRGSEDDVAWAQAIAAEATAYSRAYQTSDVRSQRIERQIRGVWGAFDTHPPAHTRSALLRSRLDSIAREIANLRLRYEEWQVVYRKALQLSRALEGEEPLLSGNLEEEENMETTEKPHALQVPRAPGMPVSPEAMSTRELVGDVAAKVGLLARKEIELAKTELAADLKQEVKMASGLGVAGVCALITLNLLCVAAVFALSTVMPGWGAAFVVAAAVLAIGTLAGLLGWAKRVREPLATTRKTLKEDLQWTREKIA